MTHDESFKSHTKGTNLLFKRLKLALEIVKGQVKKL